MKVAGQIEMLIRQREKIGEKDFDLEAWKSTASTLLSKIFGSSDPRVMRIENLKIDYGSWALRDASSNYDPLNTCKRIARDLMDLSIDELQVTKKESQSVHFEILANHLTGSQLKEISSILSTKNKERMHSDLVNKLQSYKAPLLARILGDLVGSGSK